VTVGLVRKYLEYLSVASFFVLLPLTLDLSPLKSGERSKTEL
jgi:hypothetical protein